MDLARSDSRVLAKPENFSLAHVGWGSSLDSQTHEDPLECTIVLMQDFFDLGVLTDVIDYPAELDVGYVVMPSLRHDFRGVFLPVAENRCTLDE